jgi:hypothetical protein
MDLPILFSGPMVRALIEGRKTRTRRLLKPQPAVCDHMLPVNDGTGHEFTPPGWEGEGPFVVKDREAYCATCGSGVRESGQAIPVRFAPGDRLWVREAWRLPAVLDDQRPADFAQGVVEMGCSGPNGLVRFEADGRDAWGDAYGDLPLGRLRASMHLPRSLTRLTLTVSNVRIERLKDITEEEAWAEGCAKGDADDVGGFFPAEEPDPSGIGWRGWDCARDWFADLWEEIHGEGAWDANPWVTVTSFAVQLRNIDMPRAV